MKRYGGKFIRVFFSGNVCEAQPESWKITEVRWNFFAQFDKPCLLGGSLFKSANKF